MPEGSVPLHSRKTGYLQYVDMAKLEELAAECDARVYLLELPGRFVHSATPIAHVHPPLVNPIARDGAGLIEVQVSLQESLQAIAALDPDHLGPLVMLQSRRSTEHASRQPYTAHERSRLDAATSWSSVSPSFARLDLPAG